MESEGCKADEVKKEPEAWCELKNSLFGRHRLKKWKRRVARLVR
jgi:hypothetical protein